MKSVISYQNINRRTKMNTLKMILLTALCSSFITGCSCANRNHENTTSTEPPSATEDATSTPVADKNNNDTTDNMSDAAGDIIDDAGNMVEDAGNAVGDAANSVGDAVKE